MGVFVNLCRAVTLLACVAAGLMAVNVLFGGGQSAIQQAAGAAVACAIVIIPYVFTRMCEGFFFKPAETSEGKSLAPKYDGAG